jgi:anti-sigma B factor antagonist
MTHAYVSGDIEVAGTGTALVLRISGELDASSSALVESAVMAALASASSVILDVGELTFCDSRGVAMFEAARVQATVSGATLVVRNLGPPVRRVFAIGDRVRADRDRISLREEPSEHAAS